MSLAVRLRQLADALPPGGSVTLDRDALLALADEAGGPLAGSGSGDLTAEEAATALGCSSASVRRACERGTLRAFKLGEGPRASWRIPANALDAFRAGVRAQDEEIPVRRGNLSAWRNVGRRAGGEK